MFRRAHHPFTYMDDLVVDVKRTIDDSVDDYEFEFDWL